MQRDEPIPYRFGYPFEVDLGLDNAGTWTELPNGDHIWRLRIVAPGAYSINLLYDEFWLPEGARFFIYNADQSMTIGAFTARNDKDYGKFSTGPVKGAISILEYYEPSNVGGMGILHISRVVHAYRNLFGSSNSGTLSKGLGIQEFGESGACNINVNCPAGAAWSDEKRSVVMILTSGGTRICSGAMINNVREDLIPYLLTANHCLGDEDTWIIMFNYESPNCSNIDGPTNQTVSGTTLKANNSASDFALLRLSTSPPSSYQVRYTGWSRSTSAPQSSVGIHHPSGDIKKISFENNTATSTDYPWDPSDPPNSHWRVVWDDGTTEGGSSGSPLFNPNHRIVGQLHGGDASCAAPNDPDYYGKFSMSWNYGGSSSTRLKDWLDPDNTGITTLDGIDPPDPPSNLTATVVQHTKANLSWTDNSNNEYGFFICRSDNGYPIYFPIYQVGANVTTYQDNTISWGNYYMYRVQSWRGLFISDYSNTALLPLHNWILGPDWLPVNGTGTWYARHIGGVGGWSNRWYKNGVPYGTGPSYTYRAKRSFELKLKTTSGSYVSYYTMYVTVGERPPKRISETQIPDTYALAQSHPNPFNPATTIRYDLPEVSRVSLTIYDTMGREVMRWEGLEEAGYRQVLWDGADQSGRSLPAGIYICRMVAASVGSDMHFTASRKMVLIR